MNITDPAYQPTRTLNRVICLLSLFLFIYAGIFSWQSWRKEKSDRINNLQNIMELGERAIDTYFMHLEDCLLALSRELTGANENIDLGYAFHLIKIFKANHTELLNITFIRNDGQILFTAKTPPGPAYPTVAQEPSFQNFIGELQQGRPLSIGQPISILDSLEWVIPLRYVINNNADKSFYIISAFLPIGILQSYWKDAPFTKTAALGLIRDDGFLVSRYPVPPQFEMEKIYGEPRKGTLITYLRQHQFPPYGFVQGPSRLDGPDYLHTFRRLEHFSITLFMVMPMSEIRSGWWDKVKIPYFLTVILVIGGIFIYRTTYQRERAREIERLQATEALRESEEKYRFLFDNKLYAISIFDLETLRFLDVNDTYVKLYGYSKAELLDRMNIHDVTVQHQESDDAIWQAVSNGTIYVPLRYHKRKDGTVFPVEIVGGSHTWKGRKSLFCIAQDIRERIQSEQALLESKRTYDEMVAQVPVGIYKLKVIPEGELVFDYISPRFCKMVNLTCEDILCDANAFFHLVHTEDILNFIESHEEARKTGGLFQWNGRFVVNSQIRFMHLESLPPKKCPNGDILWTGTLRDVTDIKRLEAERAQLENQLLQTKKAESLGRMAGAIAHHLNNQIYVVIGNLEMVINDLPLESDHTEKLIDAMKASHRAADVSKLMLTYLGQTPGKQELQDLSETCHKGLLMMLAVVPKNVQLEPEFPFPGPSVRVSMSQMHQIITNLVTNAWESIADNRGAITLSIKTVCSADIPLLHRFPVGWQPKESFYACLEVTDTGAGISKENIEKIFDPFFTTKFTGRGLGLPVVLGILGTHNGGITVESRMGNGCTFRVFLPLSAETTPIAVDKLETAVAIKKDGKVLLVEDQDTVRNMARAMLTRLGYIVLEAKDGIDAVEIFQQQRDEICCVLSDLTMPRMNGWSLLTALRKISPEVPVILSSGYDEAQAMATEQPERPNAFLGKPYHLKELRETINRVLSHTKVEV